MTKQISVIGAIVGALALPEFAFIWVVLGIFGGYLGGNDNR